MVVLRERNGNWRFHNYDQMVSTRAKFEMTIGVAYLGSVLAGLIVNA